MPYHFTVKVPVKPFRPEEESSEQGLRIARKKFLAMGLTFHHARELSKKIVVENENPIYEILFWID